MKMISPPAIIHKYYINSPQAEQILLDHSRQVCRRALSIARRLIAGGTELDLQFIAEAAMLHDIGMIATATPDLCCYGEAPYMQHGLLGKQMLEAEGLPRHARVCERHIGVGLTADEIRRQKLPLPPHDMRPETQEEEIICYADLFYSKGSKNRGKEKTHSQVRKKIKAYGEANVLVFDAWVARFEPDATCHG